MRESRLQLFFSTSPCFVSQALIAPSTRSIGHGSISSHIAALISRQKVSLDQLAWLFPKLCSSYGSMCQFESQASDGQTCGVRSPCGNSIVDVPGSFFSEQGEIDQDSFGSAACSRADAQAPMATDLQRTSSKSLAG